MISRKTLIEQYKNPSNLEARIALHQRFSSNKYGLQHWIFDQLDLPPTAQILELGCGVGRLWLDNASRILSGWTITLTDFSAGMLEKCRRNLGEALPDHNFTFQIADIVQIPFEPDQFDAVIANHMLYYVADKSGAFSELRRVLKPGGRLYTATNGRQHLKELIALIAAFDPSIAFVDTLVAEYSLENGAQYVSQWFEKVEIRRYEDELVVTDVDALLDYILSASAIFKLPAKRKHDLVQYVKGQFAAQGDVMRITKDVGLICAS